MLSIVFVASRVPVDKLDELRKRGDHIIPANMVGSRKWLMDSDDLEINLAVYTTDPHWHEKVKMYERLVKSYDPHYHT